MERDELIEWIIIILCIAAWWPLLGHFNPAWYRAMLCIVEPIVLIAIAVRRFRRMKEGLEYSEQVVKSQVPGVPGMPPPPEQPQAKGKR